MGCLGCSCSTGKDSAGGCNSNGGCASGGCNRHNTYDWISALGITDAHPFDVVEVSFKNGSRKDFFKNPHFTRAMTGDYVLVESAAGGYDLGKISLSGELVRMQMKRKRVREDARLSAVIRKAHERDLERLDDIRKSEKQVMIRARAIARSLDLRMKVCDVEFQGDGRKCTFFYTADGRVDFRELIRHYAREFKVKIEMRQIGARQESSRIGGLGNCGRELCCSTWLTEFKSVNTAAARYQNLAINQTKLSGMCGRLKCCLNYELDVYVEALEDFPDKAEKMRTEAGLAILIKTDVFKRLMFYTYADNKSKLYPLHVDQIWEVIDRSKTGKLPASLDEIQAMAPVNAGEDGEEEEPDFENVDNVIQLPIEKRKKKKKKKKRGDTAAAAVERQEQAEQQRMKGGGHHQSRRDDRRPAGQRPGGRPEQKGPQRPPQQEPRAPRPEQKGPQRPPQQEPRAPRPEQKGPQRPPQQEPRAPRPEQKSPQRPPQQEPRAPKPEQKGQPPHPKQGGSPNKKKHRPNQGNGNPDKGEPKP